MQENMKRLLEIRWTVSGVAFNFWITGVMVAEVSQPLASFAVAYVSAWTSAASEDRIISNCDRGSRQIYIIFVIRVSSSICQFYILLSIIDFPAKQ